MPLDEYGQLEAHRLEPLPGLLSGHGRAHGLFSGTERLTRGVADEAAWVRSVPSPDGHKGLAVHRTGQRSVWSPLAGNARGSVLDRHELNAQIERSLRWLAGLASLPAPAAVALTAGLEPAAGLAASQTDGFCTVPHLRVLREERCPSRRCWTGPGKPRTTSRPGCTRRSGRPAEPSASQTRSP